MTQLRSPMPEDDVDVQKVQTVPLRRTGANESTVIVSITEAIRAAGLEDGGSFRFMPSAVEDLRMLPALGSEEQADGRSEKLARSIYQEGANGKTLRLIIPPEALRELIDPESINWDAPPEVNVWAGDRMIAFDLADREKRTLPLDNLDSEEGT